MRAARRKALTFSSTNQPNIQGRFENQNGGETLGYPILMRIEGTDAEEHHEPNYFDCDCDCGALEADKLSASEYS